MTAARCPTCNRRHKRSNPANRFYWLLLHKMAAKPWQGQTFSAESFHRYYASRFLGCDDFPMPNGKTMTIPRSTANLDVAEFAEYFDAVQADAAERGIFLDDLAA